MSVLRQSSRRKSKSRQITLHSYQPHFFRQLCLKQCVLFTYCSREMTTLGNVLLLLFVCMGEFIYLFTFNYLVFISLNACVSLRRNQLYSTLFNRQTVKNKTCRIFKMKRNRNSLKQQQRQHQQQRLLQRQQQIRNWVIRCCV